MNRADCKLIAEELYKLIRKDLKAYVAQTLTVGTDEWLDTKQSAEYLGVSVSYIKQNLHAIPHTKVGRLNKFRKSDLHTLLMRT